MNNTDITIKKHIYLCLKWMIILLAVILFQSAFVFYKFEIKLQKISFNPDEDIKKEKVIIPDSLQISDLTSNIN